MNKWKIAFFVTLFLLITSVFGGLYILIDSALSLTYLEVSYDDEVKNNEILGTLLKDLNGDMTQKDWLVTLRKHYPKELITEKENTVSMWPLTLEFEQNKLIEIH